MTAFEMGWESGRKHGPASPREAETALRPYGLTDTDAFCNGSDDGASGERFRLDLMRTKAAA